MLWAQLPPSAFPTAAAVPTFLCSGNQIPSDHPANRPACTWRADGVDQVVPSRANRAIYAISRSELPPQFSQCIGCEYRFFAEFARGARGRGLDSGKEDREPQSFPSDFAPILVVHKVICRPARKLSADGSYQFYFVLFGVPLCANAMNEWSTR